MTRFILYATTFCCLIFTTSSCDAQKTKTSEKERINKLTETSSSDAFMNLFLKFIKDNNLSDELIKYEDELIGRKYLGGYDRKALDLYFRNLIIEQNDKRCISKSISEKIAPLFSKFNYNEYKKKIEQSNTKGTKEYNFVEYLKNDGNLWRKSLEYALKDNELTTEKRYFYLLMTMPFKKCD